MEVQIANPIYDVVFKYMMEDNAVAKLVVSSIIKEEVLELVPKPQEHTTEKQTKEEQTIENNNSSLTVYRLDFSAKIKTPDGQKLIIIEMQKASLPTDIPRFRRYLGEQYINPNNDISTSKGISGLQLYCIYFLGKDFGIDCPVVRINPNENLIDDATYQLIKFNNNFDFITALNHKMWIIQINCLKERRRTELEQWLAVFDQKNITKDWHILNVKEENFPEKFRPIIRRLKSAASDKDVKNRMKEEDGFIKYMQDWIRREREEEIEKSKKEIEEKNKEIAEKDNALAEKDKEIAELKKLLGNKFK